jgi:hypothetical protein
MHPWWRAVKCIFLSVIEAEFVESTHCAQELLAHKHTLESIGLKVTLPMLLEVENKGEVDLIINWNFGGRTRHIDVLYYFIRELKEAGILNESAVGCWCFQCSRSSKT